ncbi:MAG: 30S ribosomal protein S16 [Planctomycetes bacterium]|nr:30S ribosomal protein S16 [Planctomycetota bacterium]
MAVRIRLARHGRKHTPFYRVVALDSRKHREGRANEILGTYDPLLSDNNLKVNLDRIHYWINKGAELNKSVEDLLGFSDMVAFPEGYAERKAEQNAKKKAHWAKRQKKDGSFKPASKRAVKKHEAKLKAARLGELNKAAEAKAAAAAAEAAKAEAEAAAAAAKEAEASAEAPAEGES